LERSSVDNEGYQCKTEFTSACYGTAIYEHADQRYCILHLPSEDKEDEFNEAVQSKLERNDFDFAGVYFPRDFADFFGATFSEEADFSGATFSGVAYFIRATFSGTANFMDAAFSEGADFKGATFSGTATFTDAAFSGLVEFPYAIYSEGADFPYATFSGTATFREATFSERATFNGATFSEEADFSGATFSGLADFPEATFSGVASFMEVAFKEGALFDNFKAFPRTALVFREATIEKPERISFHTTFLRPSWFVDVVDAQKFDFSDVEWFRIPDAAETNTDQLKPLTLENEIENLVVVVEGQPEDKTSWVQGSRTRSLRKLARACRRLMNNAEENRDYPTANEMHYWSMEAQRKEGWSRLGLIATLYWALSGYGERPLRALGVLGALYAVFTMLYILLPASPFSVLSPSDVCQSIGCVGQAATYSLSAVARLIPAEPRLSPGSFQFLVTIEGILGPLQIALFLLAVRRKVMR